MTPEVKTAAASLLVLTALAGVGVLVHGSAADARKAVYVTSPTLADQYNRAFDELKTTTEDEAGEKGR